MKNLKDKALEYYNKMGSDSKRESYAAERELRKILMHVINKLDSIESTVGLHIHNYPDTIDEIEYDGHYNELPDKFYCNDGYDYFHTEWFDIDPETYFNDLKARKLSGINYTIEKVESSLAKHRENLKRITELNFSDVKYNMCN